MFLLFRNIDPHAFSRDYEAEIGSWVLLGKSKLYQALLILKNLYPKTVTGICLLHPERTDQYNDVIDAVCDHKSEEFHFYGSGGSAKVMGSHPSLISAPLCGKGGSFA